MTGRRVNRREIQPNAVNTLIAAQGEAYKVIFLCFCLHSTRDTPV